MAAQNIEDNLTSAVTCEALVWRELVMHRTLNRRRTIVISADGEFFWRLAASGLDGDDDMDVPKHTVPANAGFELTATHSAKGMYVARTVAGELYVTVFADGDR